MLGPAPTVLVFHGMEDRSDTQLQLATRLTAWVYQAISVDFFGEEVSGDGIDSTTAAMAGSLCRFKTRYGSAPPRHHDRERQHR